MKRKIKAKTMISLVFVLAALACVAVVLRFANQRMTEKSFPRKYEKEISAASEQYGVDQALIYSVIKTESNFDPDAKSPAGAMGLMQIMPETFEWMRTSYKDSAEHEVEDLYDPAINIDYGVHYLSILLKMYQDEETAVCAYNAGCANVDRWLQNPDYSDDGKTLKNVPYEETDNYRQRIREYKSIYQKLYFSEK